MYARGVGKAEPVGRPTFEAQEGPVVPLALAPWEAGWTLGGFAGGPARSGVGPSGTVRRGW